MSSLQQVLALVFKRKGKGVLSEKEFVFSASIDFRWFTPKEAQRLLEMGLDSKLLVRTNDFIKPNFDYKAVDVPLDLRPGREVLSQPPVEGAVFPTILQLITDGSGLKKREAVARINRIQERLGVDIEVASLVVARTLGIDIRALIPRVKDEVMSR